MAGTPDLGDVPTWLTAATPVAIAMLEGRRRNRVALLGRQVEELIGATDDLADRVLSSDELEELVNRAVEDAARTTWQEKLDALASVIAAAVAGDDTLVSSSLLIEAALSRLERPHALALRHIADSGPSTKHQLGEVWPGSKAFLDPVLSVLASEGLVRNIAVGTYDGLEGHEKWALTDLGEELLDLLSPGHNRSDAPGSITAEVFGSDLTVVNTGRVGIHLDGVKIAGGNATSTLVPTDGRPAGYPLAPDEELKASFMMIPSGLAVVTVVWTDRHGQRTSTFNVSAG